MRSQGKHIFAFDNPEEYRSQARAFQISSNIQQNPDNSSKQGTIKIVQVIEAIDDMNKVRGECQICSSQRVLELSHVRVIRMLLYIIPRIFQIKVCIMKTLHPRVVGTIQYCVQQIPKQPNGKLLQEIYVMGWF